VPGNALKKVKNERQSWNESPFVDANLRSINGTPAVKLILANN